MNIIEILVIEPLKILGFAIILFLKLFWLALKSSIKALYTDFHLDRKLAEIRNNFRDSFTALKAKRGKFTVSPDLTKIPRIFVLKIPQLRLKMPKLVVRPDLAFFVFGVFFAFIFLVIPYVIYTWFRALPNPDLVIVKSSPRPTQILDRKGRLLYEIYVDRRYEPVHLDQIPKYLIDATIAIEDDGFYMHPGFDLLSMLRAAKATIFDENLQGASTITQQLVKNVLLTSERTISRKIKELVLSILVEAKYTKKQILELYLNNISYGGTAWGVQTAAQKYFGKDVSDLSLAESAMLAGLPSAPSAYSPTSGNLEAAISRQKQVLSRMLQLKKITKEQYNEALVEPLSFSAPNEFMRAPHFVAFVRSELEKKYGRRFVELGGLSVTTTLDLDMQDKVQAIVTEEVKKNEYLLISNGASVVLDAKNAEILAYVGSYDYYKEGYGAFDVASGYRQPGSSIKPVTYALALEKGYTPASILSDTPVTFKVAGSAPYTPKNYDGKYRNNVTLRTALACSLNIPAVRLAAALGPQSIVLFGKEMGLTNWDVDGSYGLSVTLGGEEVRLLDLANVYGTFARGGEYLEVSPFLSVKDSNGYEIYDPNSRVKKQVLSKEVSYLIWHILSDNVARTPVFGPNSKLVIPGKTVAVKTGTTDQIRDNYTVGFTPSYVTAVWVGNNDNTALHPRLASGVTGAAPMWNRIMSEVVLKDKNDEVMQRPDGIIEKYDDKCKVREVFVKGSSVPSRLCAVNEDKDKKEKD